MLQRVLMDQEKKDGGEVTMSTSEFFASGIPCEKIENGYYKWNCVSQKCKNCKNIKPMQLISQESETIRKVAQFEATKKPYKKIDENGNEVTKISKKTERVEYDLSLKEIYQMITKNKKKYPMHRYQVMNDNYYWPLILAATEL